jgi:imidazolonepropionase-like amidohydrolase
LLAVASDNLRRLHEGGVTIVVGSDTPVGWTYPGLDTLYEIELLVKAGLSPLDAIQAATFDAARSLEIDGQLGSIRKGMLADMLIVRGNALEDISAIRYPSYVIQNGRVVRGLE